MIIILNFRHFRHFTFQTFFYIPKRYDKEIIAFLC